MGAAGSKLAPDPQTKALLDASIAAARQWQLPDQSQPPAHDELRDLEGYKTDSQKFLLAHPGNRIHNGAHIHHKAHYHLHERGTSRDFHHVRYFRFRRTPMAHSAPHSKIIAAVQSANTVTWKDDPQSRAQDECHIAASHQRSTTTEEMPSGGNRYIPLKMPRRSKLLSIYGSVAGEPVRCLLDIGCQSQLCDRRFANTFLTPTRLENTWYIGSHQQGPLTPVTECVRAEVDLGGHIDNLDCFVTDLHGYDIVLGLDWFERHNPLLDFLTRTVKFGAHCTGDCVQPSSVEVRCDLKDDGCTVIASPDDAAPFRILAMLAEMTEEDDGGGNKRGKRSSRASQQVNTSTATSKDAPQKRSRPKAVKARALKVDPALNPPDDDAADDADDTIQVASASGKRKAGSGTANPPSRKRNKKSAAANLMRKPAPWFSKGTSTALNTDDIGFPLDESTSLLNKFINLVRTRDIKEKPHAPRAYTPSFEQPQHVLDLPPFAPNDRLYELVEDKVTLVKHTQPDGTNTKRWRMLARNTMDPSAKEIELFLLQSHRYAIITSDACSDKSKVLELGKIAVSVMNNAPFELEAEDWKSPRKPNSRDFVTIVSLVRWKETCHNEFDFSSMPCRSMTIDEPTGKLGWCMRGMYWAWQTDGGDKPISRTVLSPKAKFDTDAIMAEDFDGNDFPFLGRGPAQTDTDQVKAAYKLIHMCMYKFAGMIGTKFTITQKLEEWKTPFVSSLTRNPVVGPYNKANIWTVTAPRRLHHDWALVPSAEVIKNLVIDGKVTIAPPQLPVINLQNQLTVRTTIADPACLAWAAQQSLNALARGDDLVRILFAAVVAVQRLELGLVTKKQVLASYCLCDDAAEESRTDHLCAVCFKVRGCATLSKELTPEGTMPQCAGCSGRTFQRSGGRYSVANRIKFAVFGRRLYDSKAHEQAGVDPPAYSELEFVNSLHAAHHTDDDAVWRDGYSDKTVSIRDAMWPPTLRNLGIAHPASLSLEKPYQRWLFQDGTIGLHVPDVNATLTKLSMNILKGVHAASILPLWKKALQLRLRAAERPPRAGHYPDLAPEWELLDRAFDTQRIISGFAPWRPSPRLRRGQNAAQIRKFMAMEKSGIWDGKALRRAQIPVLFELPANKPNSLHPGFSMTDEYWDWQIILENIDYMQNDVRPGGFNPEGLKLPRCGRNKVPWLWRTDLCPDQSDYDEETIFTIFSARLRTMDMSCDKYHTTEESPATLFLEAVAQWFETGGKCHFFGCEMTPFIGHPTKFSFGRGLVQRRRAEDGGPVSISAGDRMQTGCTKLLPRDMALDYDIARRTVIVESWAVNRLRFDYPNVPELMDTLETHVLDTLGSCKWYDGLSNNIADYSKIQLPTTKNHSNWLAAIRAQTFDMDVPDEFDEEFDEDEEFDDEEATYIEHLQETEAIKASSQSQSDIDNLKDQYARVREAATALSCDGHSYVQDRLSELASLLPDGEEDAEGGIEEQITARFQTIVAELEDYMQNLADEEGPASPKVPDRSTSGVQSNRVNTFKEHMEMLKSINFLPQDFELLLDAINARMDGEEFTPQEAFAILWQLKGDFTITVGPA